MWVKSELSNEDSHHVYDKDSDYMFANETLAYGGLGCGLEAFEPRE